MDRAGPKWWQRAGYIAALAALIGAIALGTLGINAVLTNDAVDRIDRLAVDNRTTLEAIERNQAGTDELVAFVRDIQNNPPEPVDLQVFIDLLCASNDSTRRAACRELGFTPGEVHQQ